MTSKAVSHYSSVTRKTHFCSREGARWQRLKTLDRVSMGAAISYGLCQTGCTLTSALCYAAAALTFGALAVGAGACLLAAAWGWLLAPLLALVGLRAVMLISTAACLCNGAHHACATACAAQFGLYGAAEAAVTPWGWSLVARCLPPVLALSGLQTFVLFFL